MGTKSNYFVNKFVAITVFSIADNNMTYQLVGRTCRKHGGRRNAYPL